MASSASLSKSILDLPGEIRNRIYFYAIGSGPLPIPSGHIPPNLSKLQTLSKVCRQLHAETRLLPYVLNDLCFVTIPSFVAWSRRAPQEVRTVVRCVMFEYVSRSQSLAKYAGAFLSLRKVKIKPGRPMGRQKLEDVMSKNRIEWKIVEEEEPWGLQPQQHVVPPPFVFVSRPGIATRVVSTPMFTTTFMVPMVPTGPMVTTPSVTTPDQLPPTTGQHSQVAAHEDACPCRDVNRDLQPLLHRILSRHCSCSFTRIVDVSIEESIDTLAENMQRLQIL